MNRPFTDAERDEQEQGDDYGQFFDKDDMPFVVRLAIYAGWALVAGVVLGGIIAANGCQQ